MSFRVGNNMDSEPYPERPGEPDCAYYLRSGYCIFGMNCRFNHPPVRKSGTCKFHPPKDSAGITERVHFNVLGYLFRPNAKDCSYYLMTGQCKFRGSCRFNHPEPSDSLLSLTNPGQQSYPERLTSFLASPNSSSYTQRLNPQGLVQVPSWNPFHVAWSIFAQLLGHFIKLQTGLMADVADLRPPVSRLFLPDSFSEY